MEAAEETRSRDADAVTVLCRWNAWDANEEKGKKKDNLINKQTEIVTGGAAAGTVGLKLWGRAHYIQQALEQTFQTVLAVRKLTK